MQVPPRAKSPSDDDRASGSLLADLVSGARPGRTRDDQITLVDGDAPRGSAPSGGAQVRGSPGDCRKPQLGCEAAVGDLRMGTEPDTRAFERKFREA